MLVVEIRPPKVTNGSAPYLRLRNQRQSAVNQLHSHKPTFHWKLLYEEFSLKFSQSPNEMLSMCDPCVSLLKHQSHRSPFRPWNRDHIWFFLFSLYPFHYVPLAKFGGHSNLEKNRLEMQTLYKFCLSVLCAVKFKWFIWNEAQNECIASYSRIWQRDRCPSMLMFTNRSIHDCNHDQLVICWTLLFTRTIDGRTLPWHCNAVR